MKYIYKLFLFDIDHTLIVNKEDADILKTHDKSCIKKIDDLIIQKEYYSINVESIKQIFKIIIDINKNTLNGYDNKLIDVGFITSGTYIKNDLFHIFEKIYDLKDIIKDCFFINGHQYGNVDTTKDIKILAALNDGYFDKFINIKGTYIVFRPEINNIWLIDDLKYHLEPCILKGINIIYANGYPINNKINQNNKYINEILEAIIK